ncbi:class I SAM-dependent methyltransferase [Paenibacillus silvae]|uniref:class I SAM-dependent methyltransferase n=1 Tax=Paenibacillus silvae TaxID=1325358 RepID=UPI0020055E55|nr:class I SAM-dependent methyltransferase [Paenibacillus silvae]MCK6076054.1 class I SAM-dependent methyltransferase [Paenibacillus silvae]MCK6150443.1 class I SAM-dependent methyltransferase [Paenibacillus silvae]MCK6268741.1 class I SAM-dependent methyltransferase [Paenibacillus silvae]
MMIIQYIPWLIAVLTLIAVICIVIVSWKNGISPMPASRPVRQVVIQEVNRIPGYADIMEAGSGWGTLGMDVVMHCPGKRLTGIENSLIPLWTSQWLTWLSTGLHRAGAVTGTGRGKQRHSFKGRLRFIRGNIYTCSYAHADGVICYLFPGAMTRLTDKFKRELPPGARVISVCFALPGKEPLRTITCRDALRTKVYVYAF